MKNIFYIAIMSLFLIIGCNDDFKDVVDITTVVNPNLSEEAVVGKENSAKILLLGLERQTANLLNELIVTAELGSDNYVNTQTYFSQIMDKLDIRSTDTSIKNIQFGIARLRELAKFGLDKVGPNDAKYETSTKAEYHFYKGLSYLYAGMYFSYLPQEENGKLFSSKENLEKAVESFTEAYNTNPQNEYILAKARAYYFLGEKSLAITEAEKVVNSGDVLKEIRFDQKDGPRNIFEDALYQRSTYDDLQPLPSLDFLDPKYSYFTDDKDQSIYILKKEEAYLILAEAQVTSNVGTAKNTLKSLVNLVNGRETKFVDETIEQRSEKNPNSRPNKSSITVDGKSGLMLDRTAQTKVPIISGTSVTPNEIDSLSTEDEVLQLIYKMRQEIFIGEGLRFVDMGVKLVLAEEEIRLNPNVTEGGDGTIAVIPSFIKSIVSDLDAFDYDAANEKVTLKVNVSKILVENKTSPEVLPFH